MARRTAKEFRHLPRVHHAAVIAVLVLGVPLAHGAEVGKSDPPKPSWKWTLDERLAARFDPATVEALAAEQQAREQEMRQRSPEGLPLDEELARMKGPAPVTLILYGGKTPELYLPGELFAVLLDRAPQPEKPGPDLKAELRVAIERRAAALGFGSDLWDRLEKVAAPYVRLQRAAERRAILKEKESAEAVTRRCRARAEALQAAQAEFGREAFLRLLYEAVAPDAFQVHMLGPKPVDYQQHAERARFQAGGCQ